MLAEIPVGKEAPGSSHVRVDVEEDITSANVAMEDTSRVPCNAVSCQV